MAVELNAHEARVLGVLIEKAMTTPDSYPMTLNALTNGCNQRSNRDPELDLSEAEVTVTLTGLQMKHLVGGVTPAGSRVQKWRHNAKEVLGIDDREAAVLAELLLRGAQTAGELRTRAKRMRDLPNLEVLDEVVRALTDKRYVRPVAPAPGSRAGRFAQTLAASRHLDGTADEDATVLGGGAREAHDGPAPTPLGERVGALEREVETLRKQLAALAAALGEPLPDVEQRPRRLGLD
ncbi:MAG: DUF480 domain-containing protein [Planctomycetota bacterium]